MAERKHYTDAAYENQKRFRAYRNLRKAPIIADNALARFILYHSGNLQIAPALLAKARKIKSKKL